MKTLKTIHKATHIVCVKSSDDSSLDVWDLSSDLTRMSTVKPKPVLRTIGIRDGGKIHLPRLNDSGEFVKAGRGDRIIVAYCGTHLYSTPNWVWSDNKNSYCRTCFRKEQIVLKTTPKTTTNPTVLPDALGDLTLM